MAPELVEVPRRRPPVRVKSEKEDPGWWNKMRRPGGEHLTRDQVKALERAAKGVGRHGSRDELAIYMAFRHALRAAELVALHWDQIDPGFKSILVRRVKGSIDGTHDLDPFESKALKKIAGERRGHVFVTERGGPWTTSAWFKLVARAGRLAGLAMPVHPHMLRHSCGYHLANHGRDIRMIQAWMGHSNIQNTVGYTALSADRFKNFFPD